MFGVLQTALFALLKNGGWYEKDEHSSLIVLVPKDKIDAKLAQLYINTLTTKQH